MSRVRDLYLTICEITTSKHDRRCYAANRYSTRCIAIRYSIFIRDFPRNVRDYSRNYISYRLDKTMYTRAHSSLIVFKFFKKMNKREIMAKKKFLRAEYRKGLIYLDSFLHDDSKISFYSDNESRTYPSIFLDDFFSQKIERNRALNKFRRVESRGRSAWPNNFVRDFYTANNRPSIANNM